MPSVTPANSSVIAAAVVAQVPAHAAIPSNVMTTHVNKLLSDLDIEVVAQAEWAAELASKKPKK